MLPGNEHIWNDLGMWLLHEWGVAETEDDWAASDTWDDFRIGINSL
jgi:hypothetical protein